MESPWSGWATSTDLKLPSDEDVGDSLEPDSIQLAHRDFPLFGQCPAVERFYCIQCSKCSKILKSSDLLNHTDFHHRSNAVNSTSGPLEVIVATPAALQTKKNLVIDKKNNNNNNHHQNSRQRTSVTVKKYSSSTTGPTKLKLTTTTTTKEMPRRKSRPSRVVHEEQPPVCDLEETLGWRPASIGSSAATTIATTMQQASAMPGTLSADGSESARTHVDPYHTNAATAAAERPVKKRFLPCKDRTYDPNEHCGVVVTEGGKPCTRSLTCKSHSLSLRRAVPGRCGTFDELLSKRRGNPGPSSSRSSIKSNASSRRTSQAETPDTSNSMLLTAEETDLPATFGNNVNMSHESLANLAAVQSGLAIAVVTAAAPSPIVAVEPPTQPPLLDSHDQTDLFQCIQMALNSSAAQQQLQQQPQQQQQQQQLNQHLQGSATPPGQAEDLSQANIQIDMIENELPSSQTAPSEISYEVPGPSGSYAGPMYQDLSDISSHSSDSFGVVENTDQPPPPMLLRHDPLPPEFLTQATDSSSMINEVSVNRDLDLRQRLAARPAAVNSWNNRLLNSSLSWATQWGSHYNLTEQLRVQVADSDNGTDESGGQLNGLKRKLPSDSDEESAKLTRRLLMCESLNVGQFE